MKTIVLAVAVIALAATPIVARQHPAQHQADPDKTVAGGGTLPAGWKARADSGSLAGVKVAPLAGGVQVLSGPAGIYYKPADKATGAYEAKATFTQMTPAAHPEAYGLIVGGADLEGAAQKYTYFLIRQDGKYLIKRRAGDKTPTIADWTDSAAIKKADSSGKMSNTLSVEVAADKVRFLVNGTEVHSANAAQVDVAGIAGLRINHNLNVHVEAFTVKARS
jgi:hypothetical protein